MHHEDNALADTALSVKMFLAKYNIPLLDHLAYSPDLTPCDFYFLTKVKSVLKGTKFQIIEAMKKKSSRVMKGLTEKDF